MYLFTCIILFFLGSIGLLLSYKNFIFMIMCLELLLLSINMLFFFFCLYSDNLFGYVYIFYILTIAAAETAVGLSLIVLYFSLINSEGKRSNN